MTHPLEKHILDLLKKNGEMSTREIVATMPDEERNLKEWLVKLRKTGKVDMPVRGRYILASTSTKTQLPNKTLKQISDALRAPDANKKTIDRLLNIYDAVLDNYEAWVLENVGRGTDFEKQLLFIENFKGLTAIGDKLMKRWSLEHVGYDTNTRQAQEDAKAKTAEREKAAVEGAPLKDRVVVVGKYDPKAEKLLDRIPSSLEEMSDEETEGAKV